MPIKRHKKKIKIAFISIVLLLVLSAGAFAYFLISNRAPALYGKVHYNIQYNEKQTLDVYLPTKEVYDLKPVLLYIHGGAWVSGYKEVMNADRFNGAINDLRENGYAIVSINYTLASSDQSPFPACITDGYEALEWIKNNKETYGFDLNNIGVLGESAGAHIAMMLTFSEPGNFDLDYQSTDLKYLIDVYGPNDLYDLYHMQLADSMRQMLDKLPQSWQNKFDISQYLFGFNPEENPEEALEFMKIYSPGQYLNKVDQTPILMIHGDADQLVPVDQSLDLKVGLDSFEIENEILLLPEVDHAFRGATSLQKKEVQQKISAFIKTHLDQE